MQKYEDLVGKWVEITVPMTKKDFYFHGKLLHVDADIFKMDDVEDGIVDFPIDSIKAARAMTRLDFIALAPKYNRVMLELKSQQFTDNMKRKLKIFG